MRPLRTEAAAWLRDLPDPDPPDAWHALKSIRGGARKVLEGPPAKAFCHTSKVP